MNKQQTLKQDNSINAIKLTMKNPLKWLFVVRGWVAIGMKETWSLLVLLTDTLK